MSMIEYHDGGGGGVKPLTLAYGQKLIRTVFWVFFFEDDILVFFLKSLHIILQEKLMLGRRGHHPVNDSEPLIRNWFFFGTYP